MQKLAKEFNYLKNPIQGVKKFHLPILFYDTADMLMSGERCHVPPISICPNLNKQLNKLWGKKTFPYKSTRCKKFSLVYLLSTEKNP